MFRSCKISPLVRLGRTSGYFTFAAIDAKIDLADEGRKIVERPERTSFPNHHARTFRLIKTYSIQFRLALTHSITLIFLNRARNGRYDKRRIMG